MGSGLRRTACVHFVHHTDLCNHYFYENPKLVQECVGDGSRRCPQQGCICHESLICGEAGQPLGDSSVACSIKNGRAMDGHVVRRAVCVTARSAINPDRCSGEGASSNNNNNPNPNVNPTNPNRNSKMTKTRIHSTKRTKCPHTAIRLTLLKRHLHGSAD